jgi:hypothetical protein
MRISISIALFLILTPLIARAQIYSGTGSIREVFVGTETESYLRALSLTDTTLNDNWTIRPLSPRQLNRRRNEVTGTPWERRLHSFSDSSHSFEARFLSPSTSARFNSAFPYGSNDGAIWAGRGLTTSASFGGYARFGPLSLTIAPIFFRAENTAFPLAPSGIACGCGEPLSTAVDRPQRFGTTPYQRFDPGQSSIRLDAFGLSAGLSSANEGWGPSAEYPFLLGNNAPGFPHLFFGSSAPFPIFIGRVHARVIYGRLDQSAYSSVTGSKFYESRLETGRLRFASGLVASFEPRGIDGLEIGGARFIHSVWPREGIPPSYFRKPLQAFLKRNLPGIDQQIAGTDNQLASIFARWDFRESGLEVYGEYGREDHSYDLRDFVQEPDHQRAYSLGFGKVVARKSQSFSVLRVELINFQLPPLATTGRGEGSIYVHSPLTQGHTNRGQLLGSDVGVDEAAASTVRWDHYSTGGRWAMFWRRNVRMESGDPSLLNPTIPQRSDVLHAFGFERLKFTRRFDVTTSLTLMRDLSRNLSNSKGNVNAAVSITLPQ